jgi:hypothetical protein
VKGSAPAVSRRRELRSFEAPIGVGKSFVPSLSASLTVLNVMGRHLLTDNSLTFGGVHYNNPRRSNAGQDGARAVVGLHRDQARSPPPYAPGRRRQRPDPGRASRAGRDESPVPQRRRSPEVPLAPIVQGNNLTAGLQSKVDLHRPKASHRPFRTHSIANWRTQSGPARTAAIGRDRRIQRVSCAFCHRSLSGEQPASRRPMTVRPLRADHAVRRRYRPHFGARDPERSRQPIRFRAAQSSGEARGSRRRRLSSISRIPASDHPACIEQRQCEIAYIRGN